MCSISALPLQTRTGPQAQESMMMAAGRVLGIKMGRLAATECTQVIEAVPGAMAGCEWQQRSRGGSRRQEMWALCGLG